MGNVFWRMKQKKSTYNRAKAQFDSISDHLKWPFFISNHKKKYLCAELSELLTIAAIDVPSPMENCKKTHNWSSLFWPKWEREKDHGNCLLVLKIRSWEEKKKINEASELCSEEHTICVTYAKAIDRLGPNASEKKRVSRDLHESIK